MTKIFNRKLLWLVIGIVILLGVLWKQGVFNVKKPVESIKEIGEKTVSMVRGGDGFTFDEDTPGYETYQKLNQGCSMKDCILSIDEPEFESVEEGNKWLEDGDVVFAYSDGTTHRAYPQRIMNWHEIVNDVVGEVAVVITFCPFCGSSLVFERSVDGRVLEFGVSGKLHNSNLVMYDRETKSLWQQISSEAIVGEMLGTKLAQLPMDTLRYGEWKSQYPNGEVLSRNTGYSRDYGRYPYGSYEQNTEVYFPVEGGVDETVHPKTKVYGIVVNEVAKAYTKEALERETEFDGVLTDRVGGAVLRISYDNGEVRVENLSNTREKIVPTRLFWFAWMAFYPETELLD